MAPLYSWQVRAKPQKLRHCCCSLDSLQVPCTTLEYAILPFFTSTYGRKETLGDKQQSALQTLCGPSSRCQRA